MSKSVSRLIEQGFVADTQARGVGNIQRLALTEKGKALLDPIAEELDSVLDQITGSSGIAPEALAEALRHMTEEFSKISGAVNRPAAP